MIYKNSNKSDNVQSEKKEKLEETIDINSPFQTDFFNKSSIHAEKVLFGKINIHEYGDDEYYGNSLIDTISKLNDETKKSIVIAIKYMCIEPTLCRNNEKTFRMMAVQEKVPVWFVILREAVKKVVPDLIQTQDQNNIVSIFRTA